MISITSYHSLFYKDIKKLINNSFKLTSFDTDINLKPCGSKILWNLWVKPVLKSEKNKYILVALFKNKVAGILIYGAYKEFKNLLNKKITSIILLAVDRKFQGKGIGKKLVENLLDIFRANKINSILVGTDLNNYRALNLYLSQNFRPVLAWHTLRLYPSKNIKMSGDYKIVASQEIPEKFKNKFYLFHPLLNDYLLSPQEKNKLRTFLIKETIHDSRNKVLHIIKKNEIKGICVYREEFLLEKFTGFKFIRIISFALAGKQKQKENLLFSFINYFQQNYKDAVLEIFIKADDWLILNQFLKFNFIIAHTTINLRLAL